MSAAAVLQGAGLGVGLISMLFSTRPFALGVWTQSEPVVIAVHLGAGLCWAGLALPAARNDAVARLRTWPAAPVLALALWSAATAPLSSYPLLSLLGPPQTGEGALWYLDLTAFMAAAGQMRDRRPALFDVMTLAAAALVALAALSHLPLSLGLPKVFSFGKFLGPCALALFPLAWDRRRRGGREWGGLLAVAVFAVFASGNRAVLPGLAMALPVLFPRLMPERRLPAAMVIAAVAAALALPYLLIRHSDALHGVFSLWSRSILMGVVDRHVLDAPLVGHGWGGFTEALVRHVTEAGISLAGGDWRDLTRDQFHSHHALVEAAYAVGLPGLVLALLVRAGFALGAPPPAMGMGALFALCLAFHDALWFTMPFAVPFLAMAAAALSGGRDLPFRRSVVVPLSAAAAVSLAAVAALVLQARSGEALRRCLMPRPGAQTCAALPAFPDLRGQGVEVSALLNTALERRTRRRDGDRVAELIRSLAAAPDVARSALLSATLVNAFARADVMPDKSPLGPMGAADEAVWRDEVLRLLRVAPARLDLAALYLNRLVRLGRDGGPDPVRAALERDHPDHPVTLWFEGLRRMAEEDEGRRRQGLELLRRALDGGVERFIPVPEGTAATLRSVGGAT